MTVPRSPSVPQPFPGNARRPEIPTVPPFPLLIGERDGERPRSPTAAWMERVARGTPAVQIPRRCRDCRAPVQEPRLRRCPDCLAKRIQRTSKKGQK
jgi:hypothetical protein